MYKALLHVFLFFKFCLFAYFACTCSSWAVSTTLLHCHSRFLLRKAFLKGQAGRSPSGPPLVSCFLVPCDSNPWTQDVDSESGRLRWWFVMICDLWCLEMPCAKEHKCDVLTFRPRHVEVMQILRKRARRFGAKSRSTCVLQRGHTR